MTKKVVGALYKKVSNKEIIQYDIFEYTLPRFIEGFKVTEGTGEVVSKRTKWFLRNIEAFKTDPIGVAYTVECKKESNFPRIFFATLSEALLTTIRDYYE